ncbi:nucleotidyltransferase domain-containing protein [candidate division KSB1 bacterium]|nr:nucleotidyltransferase domain-containing protein [candidate division KSB1 bacterium]
MKIDELKIKQINEFCHQNKISLFIIFGSYTKAKTHAMSDIDIALVFEDRKAPIDKLQLIFDLEGIFDQQVDLVVLTPFTDPVLLFEIFTNGKPVFEKESFLFEEHKLIAWKKYLDTEKLRELQHQYIKNYVRKLENDYRRAQ